MIFILNKEEISLCLEILDDLYDDEKMQEGLLHFGTPFEALVSTMLSAQCTDKRVNQVTSEIYKKYNTPEDFANLPIEEIEEMIKPCGFYHTKAKNIKATSKILLEKFGGEVPKTMEELTSLPGVGRKTANVIRANVYDIPSFAVDTHVQRVANRIGLASSKNVEGTEKDLMENVPRDRWNLTHRELIYHGRTICKARGQRCETCPMSVVCEYYRKNYD